MKGQLAVARRVLGVSLFLAVGGVISPTSARAADIDVTVQIDGRNLSAATETKPIRLDPKRDSVLAVAVVNRGGDAVEVKTVRLEGRVVGLSFFAYDTAVGLTVPPGGTGTRRFSLDLGGLDGQATGLVPGAVKLLDKDRKELASEEGVVDVRGSLKSVYGLFGLGIAVLTALSFSGCMIGLARHRLHPNRWRRAMRFLTPGLGLGLLLNFTLSATRVFVPGLGRWLTIVVVSSAVFFVLGYLTPAPDLRTIEDLEAEEEERAALRSGAPGWALPGGAGHALEQAAAGELAPPGAGELSGVSGHTLEPVAAARVRPAPATALPSPPDDLARAVPVTIIPSEPADVPRPASATVIASRPDRVDAAPAPATVALDATPAPATVALDATPAPATLAPGAAAGGPKPPPGTVIAGGGSTPPASSATPAAPATAAAAPPGPPAPATVIAGVDPAAGDRTADRGNETVVVHIVPGGVADEAEGGGEGDGHGSAAAPGDPAEPRR